MQVAKTFRRIVWQTLRQASREHLLRQLTWVHWLWGMEGVNRLLLQCHSARVAEVLARFGAVVGPEHDFHSPLLIHNADRDYSNLRIGERCHLGKGVLLDLQDTVVIEDRVTIGMGAMIITHIDMGQSPLAEHARPRTQSPVRIGRGAYIGAGAIILQGVTIGECAIVGAGALVNRNVPPGRVAVGVPARDVGPASPETDEPATKTHQGC